MNTLLLLSNRTEDKYIVFINTLHVGICSRKL